MKALTFLILSGNDVELDISTLEKAIRSLPPENRQAIELHFIQKLTRKEIATRLGWSYSKVHNRITRGVTLLKWQLNPAYFDEMKRISNTALTSCANGKEPI